MAKRNYGSKMIEGREVMGLIIGLIVLAVAVGISYYLGSVGMFALGSGGVIMGLLVAGTFGYAYSALNARRRYDYVLGIMVGGYVVGAYVIETFLPTGQFLANLATYNSGISWVVYLFYGLIVFFLLAASFFYAKRTDLR